MFAGQLFPGAHTRAPDPYRNPKRPQSIPFPEMVGEGPSPWGCKVQPDRNNDCVEAQGRGWGWDRWISARLSLSQGQAEPSALPVGTGFTVLSTGAAKCLPTLALLCFLSPWDLCSATCYPREGGAAITCLQIRTPGGLRETVPPTSLSSQPLGHRGGLPKGEPRVHSRLAMEAGRTLP